MMPSRTTMYVDSTMLTANGVTLTPMPSIARTSLALFIAWTVYSMVYASQVVDISASVGQPISVVEAVLVSMGRWLPWFPLSLAIYVLSARYPIENIRCVRQIGVHAAAIAGIIVIRAIYVQATNQCLNWYPGDFTFSRVLLDSLRGNLLMVCFLVAAGHAPVFLRKARSHERRAIELESQLLQARLDALASQLNPHFLFNTMNMIAEVTHHDPAKAERLLIHLSSMLRSTLSTDRRYEVRLSAEVELVSHYLAIQRERFGSRLVANVAIDPGCVDALVPSLLIQPLVENAIVHGIAPRSGSCALSVLVHRLEDRLRLEVEDDGVGLAEPHAVGIGIGSLRARLETMYGRNFSLDFSSPRGRGVLVTVDMPFHK